jgi:hypothetical protein
MARKCLILTAITLLMNTSSIYAYSGNITERGPTTEEIREMSNDEAARKFESTPRTAGDLLTLTLVYKKIAKNLALKIEQLNEISNAQKGKPQGKLADQAVDIIQDTVIICDGDNSANDWPQSCKTKIRQATDALEKVFPPKPRSGTAANSTRAKTPIQIKKLGSPREQGSPLQQRIDPNKVARVPPLNLPR